MTTVWCRLHKPWSYGLLDTSTGLMTMRTKGSPTAHVGGRARRCAGGVLAIYKDPDDKRLYVQHGPVRLRLDGYTTATSSRRAAGTQSVLVVQDADGTTLRAARWIFGLRLLELFSLVDSNPQLSMRDFLGYVAISVNSAGRRAAHSGWKPDGTP